MIFDFTESPESIAKRQAERVKQNHWNKWFAWHPVRLYKFVETGYQQNTDNPFCYLEIDKWIWLEDVERIAKDFLFAPVYIYREIPK
jgi:hypothetical protein